jgi:predicted transposase/invertase (TIGR01784 family)
MCKDHSGDTIRYPDPLTASPEEMEAFEVRLKHILDEGAAVREAELREQEAYEKGYQLGFQKGLQKGFQKGFQKVYEANVKAGKHSARVNIASRLLKAGMDIEKVVEVTELDVERVLEIQGERENE